MQPDFLTLGRKRQSVTMCEQGMLTADWQGLAGTDSEVGCRWRVELPLHLALRIFL